MQKAPSGRISCVFERARKEKLECEIMKSTIRIFVLSRFLKAQRVGEHSGMMILLLELRVIVARLPLDPTTAVIVCLYVGSRIEDERGGEGG